MACHSGLMRGVGCVAVLTAGLGLGLGACSKSPPPPPPPVTPAKTPPPVVEKKDPAKVLAAARATLGSVQAISYDARVEGNGSLLGKVAAYTGQVTLSKVQAEGGGWKLALSGEMVEAEEPHAKSSLEIAYDGSTVRSLRASEHAIYERDGVVEMAELAVFMTGQNAKPPVAWEMLDPVPYEDAGHLARYEGQSRIDDVPCDIVVIPTAEAGAGAGAAAGGAAPAGAGGTAPAEAAGGLRLHLGEADHLPRRIERLAVSGGVEGSRVLTLVNLKVSTPDNAAVTPVSFVLEAPSDFTHRSAQASLKKGGKGKPGQILGDPEKKLDLAMEPLAIGTPAPDWSLPGPDSATIKLSDYAGKVVVMDFWGTWCPFCLKAMPDVQKLHEKYKDKGVVVIGLNTENDPRANPAEFMAKKKYTYGLALNAEKITRQYKVFGFPTLFVIGKDGKVAHVAQGAQPDLEASVAKAIDQALGL